MHQSQPNSNKIGKQSSSTYQLHVYHVYRYHFDKNALSMTPDKWSVVQGHGPTRIQRAIPCEITIRILQYACVAWDPYQIKYISNLENVQRKDLS